MQDLSILLHEFHHRSKLQALMAIQSKIIFKKNRKTMWWNVLKWFRFPNVWTCYFYYKYCYLINNKHSAERTFYSNSFIPLRKIFLCSLSCNTNLLLKNIASVSGADRLCSQSVLAKHIQQHFFAIEAYFHNWKIKANDSNTQAVQSSF